MTRSADKNRILPVRGFAFVLLILMTWTGYGCSSQQHASGHLSAEFGQAYQAVFAAQIANPDAPEDPSPIDTLPGNIAAKLYQERIVKSLTEKQKEKDDKASEQLRGM